MKVFSNIICNNESRPTVSLHFSFEFSGNKETTLQKDLSHGFRLNHKREQLKCCVRCFEWHHTNFNHIRQQFNFVIFIYNFERVCSFFLN